MNVRFNQLAMLAIFIPFFAYAAGGDSPVGSGLGWLISQMYGTTGVALATLAIIAVGLLCLIHRIEWKYFILTVSGIAIVFGAGAIVTAIKSLTAQ
jgi:type IV secretory pathway VirB2 component (pilin)